MAPVSKRLYLALLGVVPELTMGSYDDEQDLRARAQEIPSRQMRGNYGAEGELNFKWGADLRHLSTGNCNYTNETDNSTYTAACTTTTQAPTTTEAPCTYTNATDNTTYTAACTTTTTQAPTTTGAPCTYTNATDNTTYTAACTTVAPTTTTEAPCTYTNSTDNSTYHAACTTTTVVPTTTAVPLCNHTNTTTNATYQAACTTSTGETSNTTTAPTSSTAKDPNNTSTTVAANTTTVAPTTTVAGNNTNTTAAPTYKREIAVPFTVAIDCAAVTVATDSSCGATIATKLFANADAKKTLINGFKATYELDASTNVVITSITAVTTAAPAGGAATTVTPTTTAAGRVLSGIVEQEKWIEKIGGQRYAGRQLAETSIKFDIKYEIVVSKKADDALKTKVAAKPATQMTSFATSMETALKTNVGGELATAVKTVEIKVPVVGAASGTNANLASENQTPSTSSATSDTILVTVALTFVAVLLA